MRVRLAGFVLVFAAAVALLHGQSPRLNVVFILADDLGWGELGVYGQTKIPTPNIDRLAAQGMRFTRHYSGAPVCAPARAVLMTGRRLRHSGIGGHLQARTRLPRFAEGPGPAERGRRDARADVPAGGRPRSSACAA